MLNKHDIENLNDIKIKEVEIPEWGGTVYVRSMDGVLRDWVEAEWRKPNPTNVRAMICVATICDADGKLLFDNKDVETLSKKNYAALDRIVIASAEINEITQKQIDDLKKT
jgi:hypothetical protein